METEKEKIIEELIKIAKKYSSEKSLIEWIMSLNNNPEYEPRLKLIGHVKDIDCNFKNEQFDEIYEDEYGLIIDCRIVERKPNEKEIIKYVKYWTALSKKYGKMVKPVFLLYEKNESENGL